MEREREQEIQEMLVNRKDEHVLRLVKELFNLRLEKYKDKLLANESEELRGRGKEVKDLLKILG